MKIEKATHNYVTEVRIGIVSLYFNNYEPQVSPSIMFSINCCSIGSLIPSLSPDSLNEISIPTVADT